VNDKSDAPPLSTLQQNGRTGALARPVGRLAQRVTPFSTTVYAKTADTIDMADLRPAIHQNARARRRNPVALSAFFTLENPPFQNLSSFSGSRLLDSHGVLKKVI